MHYLRQKATVLKRKKIHSLWTADKVRRIITDITYTGVQVSGKIRKVSYKGKKYKKVPPEEQIVIEIIMRH